MATRLDDIQYEDIDSQQFEDFIKLEGNYIVSNFKISGRVELIFDTIDDPKGLIFRNCIFKDRIDFKGQITNGIEFFNCIFDERLIFQISIKLVDGGSTGNIGNFSSLSFDDCEINTLLLYPSFLQRGILISNKCLLKFIKIKYLETIENDCLRINESKITDRFDVENINCESNIDISKSEILCTTRFEDVKIGLLSIHETKFDRIYFWDSNFENGISIDKSEFNGSVEFLATNVFGYFGLHNSIFNKEISVINVDHNNNKVSRINHYFIINCTFSGGFRANQNTLGFFPNLSIAFSNSLSGTMLFEKIKFLNVYLKGHNNNLALTFDDCQFTSFDVNNVTNNQTLRLSNCKSNTEISIPSEFNIKNSNLGKMNLLDFDFKSFNTISIVDSLISEIQFASIWWFDKHQLKNSNEENKETFRQLKLAAEKSSDNIAAIDFKGNELYYYHKHLTETTPKTCRVNQFQNALISDILYFPNIVLNKILVLVCFLFSKEKTNYNLGNKIILWLARVSNNYGSSWSVPLFLIFCFNFLFYILMGISLSQNIIWGFDLMNIKLTFVEIFKQPSLFFQLLNPTHDINRVLASIGYKITDDIIHWSVYAFDLLHRIIYTFLIYQMVVAFRKYVK